MIKLHLCFNVRCVKNHLTKGWNGVSGGGRRFDLVWLRTVISLVPSHIAGFQQFFFFLSTDNAIPIRSWFSDAHDTALLCLLPILDALRFVSDVRSVLSRNLHRPHSMLST
ncbi:unnamed protein product [Echinostoma caproni]|uniref:FCP1 homology domain-containing protein n=1 Tax=Echinostoma caproni TaxID=27848 RepID=A0A183AKC3_9TREM|nr:unnamed protein product [Echinostoma caproni]